MLSTELNRALPRLAWLGVVDRTTMAARVVHGTSVEVGSDYVVEGVWDGPFAPATFHEADHFFGSGIVRDERGWWLVPSRALVDRIVYCEFGREVIASNSLPLLMAWTGACLDPEWNYRLESYAILRGVAEYEPSFRVVHPHIKSFQQAFYHPLLINVDRIERQNPQPVRRFTNYAEYINSVTAALHLIHDNYSSPMRKHRMDAYTTTSTGYDSTSVSALVSSFDIAATFTSRRSNSSIQPWMSRQAAVDDGTSIARHLGLKVKYLDDAKRSVTEDELFFLAPTAADVELIFSPMAAYIERASRSAVLFSGYHGDKVWDRATSGKYLSSDVLRGDTSGLNLSEIRLKAGFVNLAIPFLFVSSISDIVRISRSAEMEPWRLGSDYDRPIPRRILEERGVSRKQFGMRKKAVVQSYNYPANRALRKMFFAWLRQQYGRGRFTTYVLECLNTVVFLVTELTRRAARLLGMKVPESRRLTIGKRLDMPYELHIWALHELTRRLECTLLEKTTSSEASITQASICERGQPGAV